MDGAWLTRYNWRCQPVDFSESKEAMRVIHCTILLQLYHDNDYSRYFFFSLPGSSRRLHILFGQNFRTSGHLFFRFKKKRSTNLIFASVSSYSYADDIMGCNEILSGWTWNIHWLAGAKKKLSKTKFSF